MAIPFRTRIILIPEDEQPSREYAITRAMVIILVALLVALLLLMALLMFSFARKAYQGHLITSLETQLAAAESRAAAVEDLGEELRQELFIMRSMQARLLFMLGVEKTSPAAADSVLAWMDSQPSSSAEALNRAASVSQVPQPSRWPVAGIVTKEFIEGNLAQGIKPHLGIDIAAPTDTPVLAAGSGVVIHTGIDEFLGNFVDIQHGLRYLTVYGHCSRIAVREGDKVDDGQLIAYVGQSGQASAPHLHFETRRQGEAVNPREFLRGEPPAH